jgi:hypothetical protein
MSLDSDSTSNKNPGADKDPRKDALNVLIDQNQRLFAIYDARRGSAAGILTADVAIAALTATAIGLLKHVNAVLLGGLVVLLLLLVASVVFAIYTGAAAGLRRGKRRMPEKIFGLADASRSRRASAQESKSADDPDAPPNGSADQPQRSAGSTKDSDNPKTQSEAPLLSTESPEYRLAARELDAAVAELGKRCELTHDVAIIVRLRTLDLWRTRRDDAHKLAQRKDQEAGAAGLALGFALLWGAVLFAVIIFAHF